MKNLSLKTTAFVQATGVVAYLGILFLFFKFAVPNFEGKVDEAFAPVIMGLLLVISATITGLLVLGRSGILFWEKKRAESLSLLGWTLFWCIAYLGAIIAALLIKA